jgi:hypothetical protein
MQTIAKHGYAYLLPNIDKNVEVSDTTKFNSSRKAKDIELPD